jgi:hypothetical protein
MRSEEAPELHRLRDRLEVILQEQPAPSDEQLPYLLNLAAAVAEHLPPLDANGVLTLATADVRNGLRMASDPSSLRKDQRAESPVRSRRRHARG